MSVINTWQAFEAAIRKELEEKKRGSRLAYHRFYDTKSAQGVLPAQPADFLVTFSGTPSLIEAKHSQVHDSLRSCFSSAVDVQQLASARVWTRARAGYFIFFYSLPSKNIEVWDGLYCADRRSLGKPLELVKRKIYGTVKEALETTLGYV